MTKIRIAFAFAFAFFCITMGHFYIYERTVKAFLGKDSLAGQVIFSVLCFLSIFSFVLFRVLPNFLRKIFEPAVFLWMGTSFIFLLVCLLSAPIHWLDMYFKVSSFVSAMLVIFCGCVLTLYSLWNALRPAQVVRISIPAPSHLPLDVELISAVVLSDIHVSFWIKRKRMQQLVHQVKSLNPSLIFITGDLVDGSVRQLEKEIAPLKELSAPLGIFYVTGNHEYYSDPEGWKSHFGQIFGWKILSNEAAVIPCDNFNVNLLGIEDRHWRYFVKQNKVQDTRLNLAIKDLENKGGDKEKALNIFLAHQPKDAHLMEKHPWIHLQISGHTHCGQMWPLRYLVKRDQKFLAGLYKLAKNKWIYVNQGTGFWGPPMRLGTRSEITHMVFRKE